MINITNHIPVLADEVLEALKIEDNRESKLFIDGTLGAAGHSLLMLKKYPLLFLLGIEQDKSMLERAEKRLKEFYDRTILFNSNYSDLKVNISRLPEKIKSNFEISENGIPYVDRILLDLGISSDQLEDKSKGLSFKTNAPLDMRLSPFAESSAAEILNNSSEKFLFKIFTEGGVGSSSKALVRKIIKSRPLYTTSEFAKVCSEVSTLYRPKRETGAKHPATVPFQALRIAVNKEFEAIESVLNQAIEVLSPNGGKLAVISFHSLEDKIVAQKMRRWSRVLTSGHRKVPLTIQPSLGKFLTPDAITPSASEIKTNPRARSARMRVFEKKPEEKK